LLLRGRRLHHLLLAIEFVENYFDLLHARIAPIQRDVESALGEVSRVERIGLGDLLNLRIGCEARGMSLGPKREG